MNRAKSAEEYIELVKQALFEIQDLRSAVEYDMDYMGGALDFLGDLEAGIRAVYDSMEKGEYRFQDQDLPFMRLVDAADDRLLPFKHLLRIINETHRKGLDTGGD